MWRGVCGHMRVCVWGYACACVNMRVAGGEWGGSAHCPVPVNLPRSSLSLCLFPHAHTGRFLFRFFLHFCHPFQGSGTANCMFCGGVQERQEGGQGGNASDPVQVPLP